jgi:hypothetical protein
MYVSFLDSADGTILVTRPAGKTRRTPTPSYERPPGE